MLVKSFNAQGNRSMESLHETQAVEQAVGVKGKMFPVQKTCLSILALNDDIPLSKTNKEKCKRLSRCYLAEEKVTFLLALMGAKNMPALATLAETLKAPQSYHPS